MSRLITLSLATAFAAAALAPGLASACMKNTVSTQISPLATTGATVTVKTAPETKTGG